MGRLHALSSSRLSVLLACAAMLGIGSASAAPVTIMGLNVDVTYDDTRLSSFSPPTLVGDSIFFTLNSHRAESLNGTGLVSAAALLADLVIVAKGNYRFGAFDLAVFGDYRLNGAGSSVDVTGQLRAFDASLPGSARAVADLSLSAPLNLADGANHNWVASARVDQFTPLVGIGGPVIGAGVRSVGLEIDTTLSAYTDAAAAGLRQAFIENKFAGLQITILPAATVPAPGTLALAALALLGLAATRGRRAGPAPK